MTPSPCNYIVLAAYLVYVVLGLWLSVRLLAHKKGDRAFFHVFRRDGYLPAGQLWLTRVRIWAIAMPFVAVAVAIVGSKVCSY
jgi:hypothetical protein